MPKAKVEDRDETTDDAATDDAATDDGAGAGSGDGDSGDGDGGDGLASQIQDAIRDGIAAALGTDDVAGDDDVSTDAPAQHASNFDVERTAARAVREALDQQSKEKERDDRLSNLEKAVEKKPIKQGKISAFLWGKVDA